MNRENLKRVRDLVADKIVLHMLAHQEREVRNDTGHGYRSAKLIAQHVDIPTDECRVLLHELANDGRIKRCDFANGVFWRSTNPLPWEIGGDLHKERERLDALWAQPLTLVVQAVRRERGGKVSQAVKAYPEALRDLAAKHVERENQTNEFRRRDDQANCRHLRSGYEGWPTYRLVALLAAPEHLTQGEG